MKKIALCFFFMTMEFLCHAQIKVMEASPISANTTTYDSLSNFTTRYNGSYESFRHLVGQRMLFVGEETTPVFHKFEKIVSNKRTMVAEDSLKGEYFDLTGILTDDYDAEILEMRRVSNNQMLRYLPSQRSEYNLDNDKWVVTAYYEKLKDTYLGQTFIYINEPDGFLPEDDLLFDIATGKPIRDIAKGSEWKCTDIAIKLDSRPQSSHRTPIVLTVENPQYGRCFFYPDGNNGRNYKDPIFFTTMTRLFNKFVMQDDYNNYLIVQKNETEQQLKAHAERIASMTKKYGKANGTIIANGSIRIGMTKQMCIDAWGQPRHINTTTTRHGTTEQWVYENEYVYFERGVITAIQN